jgi:hypothetical protein
MVFTYKGDTIGKHRAEACPSGRMQSLLLGLKNSPKGFVFSAQRFISGQGGKYRLPK